MAQKELSLLVAVGEEYPTSRLWLVLVSLVRETAYHAHNVTRLVEPSFSDQGLKTLPFFSQRMDYPW